VWICFFGLQTLVGTKKDCSDERQVSQKEADEAATKIGASYIETSLRDESDSAKEIVEGMITKVYKSGLYPQRFLTARKAYRSGSRCLIS
jgi:hypothetical protein